MGDCDQCGTSRTVTTTCEVCGDSFCPNHAKRPAHHCVGAKSGLRPEFPVRMPGPSGDLSWYSRVILAVLLGLFVLGQLAYFLSVL